MKWFGRLVVLCLTLTYINLHHLVNGSPKTTTSAADAVKPATTTSMSYSTLIGRLVDAFNTYCNKHPRVCCGDPTSSYHASGRRLSFMTADDIITRPGSHHPRRRRSTRQVLETMLEFHYKADCELCRAVNAASTRRHRRQAEFDNNQRVVTKEVVYDVLTSDMELTSHEEAMGIAIEELLGNSVNIDRTDEQQQESNDPSATGTVDEPGDSPDGTNEGIFQLGIPWWWVLLLIIIGALLIVLLIIIIIIILWRCRKRRRSRRVHHACSYLTETTSLHEEKRHSQHRRVEEFTTVQAPTTEYASIAAVPAAPVAVHHRQDELTSTQPAAASSSLRHDDAAVAAVEVHEEQWKVRTQPVSRTPRSDGDALRRLQAQLPDRFQGAANVRPGQKYKPDVGGSPSRRPMAPIT